jgi:diadenosine tetraphosphate (Ap4A) HIT family hydrolase
VLWRDARCRVVLVADPDYAGFCRVIWHAHVREMTDLTRAEQAHCMRVVFAIERALRQVLNPHKINLASLGNMTPHLHWHVIARHRHDAHFPNPVWGKRLRARRRKSIAMPAMELRKSLAAAMAKLM